jgi:hypothetical protein
METAREATSIFDWKPLYSFSENGLRMQASRFRMYFKCKANLFRSSMPQNRKNYRPSTRGGTRTHTPLRALDFESSASANSATLAFRIGGLRPKWHRFELRNVYEQAHFPQAPMIPMDLISFLSYKNLLAPNSVATWANHCWWLRRFRGPPNRLNWPKMCTSARSVVETTIY